MQNDSFILRQRESEAVMYHLEIGCLILVHQLQYLIVRGERLNVLPRCVSTTDKKYEICCVLVNRIS
jgi:hypothetical protein